MIKKQSVQIQFKQSKINKKTIYNNYFKVIVCIFILNLADETKNSLYNTNKYYPTPKINTLTKNH